MGQVGWESPVGTGTPERHWDPRKALDAWQPVLRTQGEVDECQRRSGPSGLVERGTLYISLSGLHPRFRSTEFRPLLWPQWFSPRQGS